MEKTMASLQAFLSFLPRASKLPLPLTPLTPAAQATKKFKYLCAKKALLLWIFSLDDNSSWVDLLCKLMIHWSCKTNTRASYETLLLNLFRAFVYILSHIGLSSSYPKGKKFCDLIKNFYKTGVIGAYRLVVRLKVRYRHELYGRIHPKFYF